MPAEAQRGAQIPWELNPHSLQEQRQGLLTTEPSLQPHLEIHILKIFMIAGILKLTTFQTLFFPRVHLDHLLPRSQ